MNDHAEHDAFRYFLRIKTQGTVIIGGCGRRDRHILHICIEFAVLRAHCQEGPLHADGNRCLVADKSPVGARRVQDDIIELDQGILIEWLEVQHGRLVAHIIGGCLDIVMTVEIAQYGNFRIAVREDHVTVPPFVRVGLSPRIMSLAELISFTATVTDPVTASPPSVTAAINASDCRDDFFIFSVFVSISPAPCFCYPLSRFFWIFAKKPQMVIHPDQQYLEGLLHNDTQIVEDIYRRFAPVIKHHVLHNSGSEEDAADIFQESLIDIYNQAKYKDLKLTCPFEPFLLLVCKRKWLNEIKKRGHSPVTKTMDDLSDYGEDVFETTEKLAREEEKARIFLQQFERLGEKCREILRMSLTGGRQEKIAEALGVTYGYLRKKKSECMATLLSYIQAQKI